EFTLRNHPPLEPFVVRWDYPLMHRDGSLDPTKLRQLGASKFSIESTPDIAVRVVRQHGGTMKRKECVDAIVAEYNLNSDSSAYSCIKGATTKRLLRVLPGPGHVLQVIEQ